MAFSERMFKMKKFVSLIVTLAVAVSLVSSFATVASAATAPVLRFEATQVSGTSGLAAGATGAWSWGSQKGFDVYDVQLILSGVELSAAYDEEAADWNGGYLGYALNTFSAKFIPTTTGTWGTDYRVWIGSTMLDATATKNNSAADSLASSVASSGAIYPNGTANVTVLASDDIVVCRLGVAVNSTKPLTISLGDTYLGIGDFDGEQEGAVYHTFDGKPASTARYGDTAGAVGSISKGSITLPLAPSTYDITFNVDGDVSQVKTVNSGDAITDDGITAARAGYTFAGWSATQGGAVLGSLGTASADTTFYAIFTDTATYTQVGKDKDGVVGVETLTGGTVTTVDGNEVALDGTYKAAKFTDLDLDTAQKKYRVVLFDGEEKAIMPWINIGSDIEVYTSRIVVVVKELGTHTVTSIKLEEADQ